MEPRNEGKTQLNERNGRKRQRGDNRTQQQGNASTRERRKKETRQRGDESLTRQRAFAWHRGNEAKENEAERENKGTKERTTGLTSRSGWSNWPYWSWLGSYWDYK